MNRANTTLAGGSAVRFVSWNVRGMNGPVKRARIFSHLKRLHTDIAFLQETHLRVQDQVLLRKAWIGQVYHSTFRNRVRLPETEKLPETNSGSEDSEHEDDAAEKMDGQDHNETLRVGLATISKDIKDLKQEIRHELNTLKDELKKEMKEEITTLQQEIERKLTDNTNELQTQKATMAEAQERITELEEWKIDAGEVMMEMQEQTRKMQEKVTDLEGRSRRNNIRIFGVPEETEENSTNKYVDQLLKTELQLAEGAELHIQRAHRAPAQKPSLNAPPRSIIVNFLKFETKEMILKTAWKKKIQVGNKQIFFDHDYPAEVVQKRRSYVGIKKVLKEKQIRFQTPLTRIRIHWSNGVKTYDSAVEAARAMRERGFITDPPGDDSTPAVREKTRVTPEWQRVRGKDTTREAAHRTREKLQEYHRKT